MAEDFNLGIYGMNVEELRDQAAELEIEGRSSMNKRELLDAISVQWGLPVGIDPESLSEQYMDQGRAPGPGVPEPVQAGAPVRSSGDVNPPEPVPPPDDPLEEG